MQRQETFATVSFPIAQFDSIQKSYVALAVKSMVQRGASSMEILQEVISNGMVTLEQNAIDKVLQGQLDLKQVLVSCR